MNAPSVGIDLIEIERIRQAMQNERFAERLFSAEERAFFAKRKNPYPGLAANFAAKEAFSKALGTGIRHFSLNEISVLRDEWGAPYFVFIGNAAKCAAGKRFSVSLTHTDTLAQAIVLAVLEE